MKAISKNNPGLHNSVILTCDIAYPINQLINVLCVKDNKRDNMAVGLIRKQILWLN